MRACTGALGDAYETLGDLPQTLSVYREAEGLAEESEKAARLHRKTANAHLTRGGTGPASAELDRGLKVLGGTASVERGWLQLLEGDIASDREEWQHARSYLQTAIDSFRAFGEKDGEASAVRLLANVFLHEPESNTAEGERLLLASLDLSALGSDRRLVSETHADLAHIYIVHRPDVGRALEHLAAAESALREQDYYARLASAYWTGLAKMELLGDLEPSESKFDEVASLARRTFNTEGDFLSKFNLGYVAYFRGEIEKARRLFEEVWQKNLAAGWYDFTWAAELTLEALWMVAECCLLQGDRAGFDQAATALERPEVRDRITDRVMVVHVLRGLGALIRGDKGEFELCFSRGLEAEREVIKRQESPILFHFYLVPYFYSIALRAQGRDAEAAPFLMRALDTVSAFKLKMRQAMLLRDQERFVRVLREWAAHAKSDG